MWSVLVATAALGLGPQAAQAWQGGNVVVTLMKGFNLPSLDGYGAFGGDTDAYVRFRAGGVTRRSEVVSNDLNPSWGGDGSADPGHAGERIFLGMHGSGTEIAVEAWDRDTGLEFDVRFRSTDRLIMH